MSTVNVLIVGTSGAGKSSLCNTIAGVDNTENLIFAEGEGSVSVTRVSKCEELRRDGMVMKIVDTIGLDDTSLSESQVLQSISEACRTLLGGVLHQLIYVVRGRMNEDVLTKLVQVQDTVFDANIRGYTTVVRTQFPKFRDPVAVEGDKTAIRNAPQISNLFGLATKVIYVDNPPLSKDEDLGPAVLKSRHASATVMLTQISLCSNQAPYTGPFNANPISYHERDERIRLENERQARELAELRRKQEEEERVRALEAQRRQRELAELQRQQAAEVDRLNRERIEAQRIHEENLRNIRGNSRDTGGQVREYVVYSNGNGRYIKLRGRGRFEVSNSNLTISGGDWELWQQTTPYGGSFDTIIGTVEDLTLNGNARLHGGCTYRNINCGGNLTIG